MQINCWCLRQEHTRLRVALAREHVHQAECAPFSFVRKGANQNMSNLRTARTLGDIQVGPSIISKA
jgi:hypothetical protein